MRDLKESSEVIEEAGSKEVAPIKVIKTEEATTVTTEVGEDISKEKKVKEPELPIKGEMKVKVTRVVIKVENRERENIKLKGAHTEVIEELDTLEEDIRKTIKITSKEKIDHTTRNLTAVTSTVVTGEMKKKVKENRLS